MSGIHTDIDPELERWLKEARELEEAAPVPGLDGMLVDVEKKLEQADRSWMFWLKSRASWMRRVIAFTATGLVVLLAGALTLRSNIGELPAAWLALTLGSLGLLLGVSVYCGLRPLHRPPLPRWLRVGVIGGTLLATAALALFAPQAGLAGGFAGEGSLLAHATPCFFYGLLVGLPVFLVLRLLDRGGSTLALVAACAAGLTGNLVLELHCPRNDVGHLVVGHFGVALVFVAGLALIHWLIGRTRASV